MSTLSKRSLRNSTNTASHKKGITAFHQNKQTASNPHIVEKKREEFKHPKINVPPFLLNTAFALTQDGNDHDIMSRSHSDSICRKNFTTLKPKKWLSDEVIHMFLHILVQSCRRKRNIHPDQTHLNIHTFKSFFFTKLLQGNEYNYGHVRRFSRSVHQGNIFNLSRLLIPINVNNNHWALLDIHFESKKIEYLDSLGNSSGNYTMYALQYLKDEHLNKFNSPLPNLREWTLIDNNHNIPKQENGYDCGIFVCLFAEALANGEKPHFSQNEIQYSRLWIAHTILQKCIPTTNWRYCNTLL